MENDLVGSEARAKSDSVVYRYLDEAAEGLELTIQKKNHVSLKSKTCQIELNR